MTSHVNCPHCSAPCEGEDNFCPQCGSSLVALGDRAEDPLIGRTLPGGHVVLELIDVGGMGRVYRAEQKALGRTVAVKIIHPHLLGDETVEARFITEARAASQLNHPNTVGVFDFGKVEGRLYMVMEYLRGQDLATVARAEGPLAIPRIVDLFRQVLAALEEAHHHGIIHRDLKPENVLLEPLRSGGDFVKVLDFGLAKLREAVHAQRITNPGMVCGTPHYMSPEQAKGQELDHRSDLYSCGVILFELLTTRIPFDAPTPNQVLTMHMSAVAPDPRNVAPGRHINRELADVVNTALAKQTNERFQSAADFAAALRRAVRTSSRPGKAPSLAADERCGQCDAPISHQQKFCGECGASLRRRRHTPPLPGEGLAISSDEPQLRLPLPFTGRGDQLEWLRQERRKVDSSLRTIRLVGPPGVGRTRLLDEFTSERAAKGDMVVRVTPDPWWVGLGYHALAEAITSLGDLPEDGGSSSRWAGASPEVRAGLGAIFWRHHPSPPRDRRRWSDTPPSEPVRESQRFLAAEALRWALSHAQMRTKKTAWWSCWMI